MERNVLNPPSEPTAPTPQQALLQRIVSSRPLQRAARLRELLLYIGAHAGQPDKLSEQQIGISVFGRAETYNPADDNIVRAAARQLRLKLKEYFESEGRLEPVVLEIPKGAYVPRFIERQVTGVTAPPARPPYLWMALTGVLALSTLALAVDRLRTPATPAEPDSVIRQFLKQAQGPVRFVLTDSALAAMTAWRNKTVDIESYGNRAFVEDGAKAFGDNTAMAEAWRDMGRRQITSLADVGILAKLLQILSVIGAPHRSPSRPPPGYARFQERKRDHHGQPAFEPLGLALRLRPQLPVRMGPDCEPEAAAWRTGRVPGARPHSLVAHCPGSQPVRVRMGSADRRPWVRRHRRRRGVPAPTGIGG